jgi:hypothetical protein
MACEALVYRTAVQVKDDNAKADIAAKRVNGLDVCMNLGNNGGQRNSTRPVAGKAEIVITGRIKRAN